MKETLKLLNEMVQSGVISEFSISGAVAAIYYSEPMTTAVLDVFVSFPEGTRQASVATVLDDLREQGFHEFVQEGIMVHGVPVRFLPVTPGLSSEAHAHAIRAEYQSIPIRVVDKEYLMATLLAVDRPEQLRRLLDFISRDDFDHARFDSIVDRHGLADQWKTIRHRFGICEGYCPPAHSESDPQPDLTTPMPHEALLQECLKQKAATRNRLASLPFEEKIRLLVEMQKRAANILAQRGVSRPVWPFP